MLRKFVHTASRSIAIPLDFIARRLAAAAALLRIGPRAYLGHRRAVRLSRPGPGSTFAQGVTTTLTPERADAWHRVNWRHTIVAVHGQPRSGEDVATWVDAVAQILRAHFLLSPSVEAVAGEVHPDILTVADGEYDRPTFDLGEILDWMHRKRRRWDLVVLDATQPLPLPEDLVQLQHAASVYHDDSEIGFVTPGYRHEDGLIAGYQVDRRTGDVAPVHLGRDYGQSVIPRYVLVAAAHGFYATAEAIDRVDVARRHLAGLDIDQQVSTLVRRGWEGNIRTLCFSSTALRIVDVPVLRLGDEGRRWILRRDVATDEGRRRIIFVLNATSISGGIRIVFELANGLADRGFDVEVWAIQESPTWFELRVPVRSYRHYGDLLLSLRKEDAIKVATWWETAEVVWLATVNHGVPVYLIQEFETWFYPDDPIGRAAVVASYRRELIGLTEATYQREELAEVGMDVTLIPNGYDPSVFRLLPGWTREQRTVLALGRSFFQKNFAMTERAWRSLSEPRPKLLLFGAEPDIMRDDSVDYRERPTDIQVNELYNTATVFVQTSRHEGFCLPILEAMAAGCPVITTDSHGNRDFCVDGENCVIVPQDDDAALAAVITRLLDDPAERERLSQAGLATAAAYRWPVVLDEVARFYDAVAQNGSAGQPFTYRAIDRAER